VGWHEHDPLTLVHNSLACIRAVQQRLRQKGVTQQLQALGITNQRETTIAWNRHSGVPYYNAIVWDDTRTSTLAQTVSAGDINRLRAQTGLPLASYFAGTKVKWLLDNVPALSQDLADPAKAHQVCFGTVDSWLVFQLTGVPSTHQGALYCQGEHVTDVTNASRWLFMDLRTQVWDQDLVDTVCHPRHLPVTALPTICPSSHIFGSCSHGHWKKTLPLLHNLPIAAVLGDQQAALFGQTAFLSGQAKNTYGTGMFLM
jgi:glycerol kinase